MFQTGSIKHPNYRNISTIVVFIIYLSITVNPCAGNEPQLLWRYSTGGRIRALPVPCKNGFVYIISEDRYLYALDNCGKLKWRYYIKKRVWDSLSVGTDRTIYTVCKDGTLIAVNPFGHEIWRYKTDGIPSGNPAASPDGSVYLGTLNGTLYSISHSGRLKWKLNFPDSVSVSPVPDCNARLYIPCSNNKMYAVTSWGEILWEFLLSGIPVSLAVCENDIYIGTNSGTVAAVSRDGRLIWNRSFTSPVSFVQFSKKESIYTSLLDGSIVVLDYSGNIISKEKDNSKKLELPVFSDNGIFYKGGDDWILYAFKSDEDTKNHILEQKHCNDAVKDISNIFSNNLDYIYLKNLAESRDPEMKMKAILEIKNIFNKADIRGCEPYILEILEYLAAEGIINPVYDNRKLINNFPIVRMEAVLLIGAFGNLDSKKVLISVIKNEWDEVVKASAVRAVGILKSDLNGSAVDAIAEVILLEQRGDLDNRFAEEAVIAFENIFNYHGKIPSDNGVKALLKIVRGSYNKDIRSKAQQVLRILIK